MYGRRLSDESRASYSGASASPGIASRRRWISPRRVARALRNRSWSRRAGSILCECATSHRLGHWPKRPTASKCASRAWYTPRTANTCVILPLPRVDWRLMVVAAPVDRPTPVDRRIDFISLNPGHRGPLILKLENFGRCACPDRSCQTSKD